MKEITINGKKYEVIEDNKDAIVLEIIEELVTDYFDDFDYIVGDWAYGKLRLKGFYDSTNSKVNNNNDIKNIKKYIDEKCAYGCKWFELKQK